MWLIGALYLVLATRFLPNRGLDGAGTLLEPASPGIRLSEVLLPAGSRLAGTTLRDLRFRQRFNATVLAVKRANTTLQDRLGRLALKDGDLLLL